MRKIDPARAAHQRRALLLSQEELAVAAGIDVRTVQRAEAGARTSAETAKALAAVLGDHILVEAKESVAPQLRDDDRGRRRWPVGAFIGCTFGLVGIIMGMNSGTSSGGFGLLLGVAGSCAAAVAAAMIVSGRSAADQRAANR